jgi:hypothetical protein
VRLFSVPCHASSSNFCEALLSTSDAFLSTSIDHSYSFDLQRHYKFFKELSERPEAKPGEKGEKGGKFGNSTCPGIREPISEMRDHLLVLSSPNANRETAHVHEAHQTNLELGWNMNWIRLLESVFLLAKV